MINKGRLGARSPSPPRQFLRWLCTPLSSDRAHFTSCPPLLSGRLSFTSQPSPVRDYIYYDPLAAAAVVVVTNALALADLHAGLGVVRCGGTHALFDLAGHGEEGLLNVAGVLGRGLEERDA